MSLGEQQAAEAAVTSLAQSHRRMMQERERLRRAAEATRAKADQAKQAGKLDEAAYYEASHRMFAAFQAQVECFNLSADVLMLPDPAAIAAMEYHALIRHAYATWVAQLGLDRLHRLLEADMDAAMAGRPAGPGLPPAWIGLRSQLASHPDWVEGLNRFRMEYPAFKERVTLTVQLIEALEARPMGPARLAEAKELNVPGLRGEHYRLEAHIRRFPGGLALLEATGFPRLPEEAVPAAGARKRNLTDKIKGLFKA